MQIFRDQTKAELAAAPDITEANQSIPEDKIVEGYTSSTGPFAVEVQTAVGTCSGALISAHYMLSAGHCFTSAPTQNVTVSDLNGHVIGSGSMTITTPGTFVQCTATDIALVKLQSGWTGSGSTSASWIRVFGRQLFTNAQTVLWGYGASGGTASNPTGLGIQRRTNGSPTVTAASTTTMSYTATGGVGRACRGDSGGPAVTIHAVSHGCWYLSLRHLQQRVSSRWRRIRLSPSGHHRFVIRGSNHQ